MKKLGFIVKPFLNIVAWFLKLSRHNIYYLVDKPLRTEIQDVSRFVFAHQHIENAISIAQKMPITEGGCIVDIGGGTGTTAVIFSKKYPKNDIFIFEPILTNFKFIEQVKERTSHWKLINKAAGSTSGKTQINIANRITASSLLQLNSDNKGTYGEALSPKGKEDIEVSTLDSEIPQNKIVEVLKLDVQGFELEVMKGGIDTLKRTKVIVFEVNNHQGFEGAPTYFDIDTFLREHNFELYDILPGLRENEKLLDWDAIYVNRLLK